MSELKQTAKVDELRKELQCLNRIAAFLGASSEYSDLGAQLSAVESKLESIADAAIKLIVFCKRNQYPVVGSPEFVELTRLVNALETQLRKHGYASGATATQAYQKHNQ